MNLLFKIIFLTLFAFNAFATVSTIKINGYDVEYQLEGKGKHTIFLEAGGSAGLKDWEPIYQSLAEKAQVIRYSRIGNGHSQKLQKHYSAAEYADEVKQLLSALNIEKPIIIIAHSYGASIARIFAQQYPKKVSALMLIEPASEHDVEIMRSIDLAKAEKQIAEIKQNDMSQGMSNQYLDFWAKYPLPDYPDIPNIPVTVIASVKKYPNPSILFFEDKARKMWGKLHSDWANTFPQGKAVLTNNSYHYPHHDEPEMVLKEVIELLSKVNSK